VKSQVPKLRSKEQLFAFFVCNFSPDGRNIPGMTDLRLLSFQSMAYRRVMPIMALSLTARITRPGRWRLFQRPSASSKYRRIVVIPFIDHQGLGNSQMRSSFARDGKIPGPAPWRVPVGRQIPSDGDDFGMDKILVGY